VGLRPEDCRVALSHSNLTPFGARLVRRQYLGDHGILELILGDAYISVVVPPTFSGPDTEDAMLWIGFMPGKIHLFRQDGSAALYQRS
jgi:TOBE domain